MQKIFDNKEVKNTISLILTVGIGLIGSALGNWNYREDKYFIIKLVGLIILAVLFMIFSILSYKYDKMEGNAIQEKNEKIVILEQQNRELRKEIEVYEESHIAMAAIFEKSAQDINETANSIMNQKEITFNIWNFKKECKWICEKVLNIVEELSIKDGEYAVSIFQINPLAKGKSKGITMIAHSSKYGNTPDVYETSLTFRNNSDFFAVKLFKKCKHDIVVLIDKNEVNEKFVYKDENNHPDYSQYIAMPIHCSGNEMLSLLQIVAFGEAKIGNTKAEIMDKLNKYIFPYTRLGLMMYKYEKGLLNSGYLVEKMKEK